MEFHPFSEIWPALKGKAFDELVASIKSHGLRNAILTYQGKILDGRARYQACIEAGVEPVYDTSIPYGDDQALECVWALNQMRRHMSKLEAIVAAERYATLVHGGNRRNANFKSSNGLLKNEVIKNDPDHYGTSMRVAAKRFERFGVNIPAIKKMRAVRKYAGEPGVQEVLAGKVSLARKCEEVRANSPRGASKKQTEPQRPKVVAIRHGTKDFALSRQQVDPEFVGTDFDFTNKYGHVVMHTAEERARMRFGDWAVGMHALAKEAKRSTCWSDCDESWLRSPRPQDIARMTEALDALRPKIARAEALLQVAVAASKAKATA